MGAILHHKELLVSNKMNFKYVKKHCQIKIYAVFFLLKLFTLQVNKGIIKKEVNINGQKI